MPNSYEHYVARAEAIAAHWASRVDGVDWSELRRQILDLIYEETADLQHPHEGSQWVPVSHAINEHGMELYADELAVTIGQDDTALATFAWPEEGGYAVCRRAPATEPRVNKVPLYTNEQIDDIVDKHIFLDNGTSTYRVWEDRANKYLRELRDKYEAELAFWQRYGVVKNLELMDAKGAAPATGVDVPYQVKSAIGDVWGFVYANASPDDLEKAAQLLMAWLHEETQRQGQPPAP